MKATDKKIQEIISRPFTLGNLEALVEREVTDITTWPALINRAIRPTMFFIEHIPSEDGERKTFVVTKENWCALYALFAGKDLEYYKPHNVLRTLVCEPPIAGGNEGTLIFITRKNWYKIAIIALLTVRVSWFLISGFAFSEGLGLGIFK